MTAAVGVTGDIPFGVPLSEADLDAIFGKPEDDRPARVVPLTSIEPPPRKFEFYSVPDLDALPKQEWLIDKALPAQALVGLIGPKGTFKTFAALDIALHIAFGLDWHGRTVSRSSIAYIFSEGAFGARERVNAWLAYHERSGLSVDRSAIPIKFLPGRVPMNNAGEVVTLERDIREQFPDGMLPRLIVVDTLNRNLDGDEDGKGMTGYTAGCSKLQEALGVTVLSVHHTPLGTDDRGRGHGAFDGALDTRFIISRDDERVTLECTHQRNAPDDWSVVYEAIPFAGSLVLKPSSPDGGQLRGQRRELLELVSQMDTPATYTTLLRESEMKAPSFKKALRWLRAKAYVNVDRTKYKATDAGRQALGIPRDTGGIPR